MVPETSGVVKVDDEPVPNVRVWGAGWDENCESAGSTAVSALTSGSGTFELPGRVVRHGWRVGTLIGFPERFEEWSLCFDDGSSSTKEWRRYRFGSVPEAAELVCDVGEGPVSCGGTLLWDVEGERRRVVVSGSPSTGR